MIQPLTPLTVPSGPVLGNADAVVAEAAFTNIPIALTDLLASDHALKVHLSKAQIQIYLACGDIGGATDADGALIVGLKELDNSGYTGIAYLVPAANGSTNVSVLIAKVLPGGGIPAAAATPAAGAAETPAAAARSASGRRRADRVCHRHAGVAPRRSDPFCDSQQRRRHPQLRDRGTGDREDPGQ